MYIYPESDILNLPKFIYIPPQHKITILRYNYITKLRLSVLGAFVSCRSSPIFNSIQPKADD